MTENAEHTSSLDLEIGPDSMSARLRVRASSKLHISKDRITDILNHNSVVYGVKKEALESLANGEKTDVLIAEGKHPDPGQDGVINFLIDKARDVPITEDGRADFRNMQNYTIVEKGQELARRRPAIPGKPGYDITGAAIDPPAVREQEIRIGQNVAYDQHSGVYISKIKGIYIQEDDFMDVSPDLVIEGDAGLETGNIDYHGNVKITGTIQRGTTVTAGQDLTCGGLIESGEIIVGGNLTCSAGIHTNQEHAITVRGNISAMFIENSTIECDGDVIVQKSIMNGNIKALGNLSMPNATSSITSGDIVLFGSLRTGVLGNPRSATTRIHVGTHFRNAAQTDEVKRQIEEEEKIFARRTNEIEKIKVYVTRMKGKIPEDKKVEIQTRIHEYKQLLEMRKMKFAKFEKLKKNRYNSEPVHITALDVIHPGTELFYKERLERVEAPLSQTTVTFKPDSQKMNIEAAQK